MAVKSERSTWRIVHFLVRLIGLNGLVAVAVGMALWHGLGYEEAGIIVAIVGGSCVALALIAEVRGMAGAVASQRGAAGVNVFVQIALASVLVVAGNYYSFSNYKRFDWTADRHFTLSDELRAKLEQLRSDTDIIVYLQHVSFGQRVDLRRTITIRLPRRSSPPRSSIWSISFKRSAHAFAFTSSTRKRKPTRIGRRRMRQVSEELVETMKKSREDSIFFYARDEACSAPQLQRYLSPRQESLGGS